jgi:hypothetical protein
VRVVPWNLPYIWGKSTEKPHFTTLPHKPHDIRNNKLLNIKFVFFSLQHLSETYLPHSTQKWDNIKDEHGLHVQSPIFLSRFNVTSIFSKDLRIIFKYQISWKSVEWEPSCCMRTDITKLIVAFRNFAEAPKHDRTLSTNKWLLVWPLSSLLLHMLFLTRAFHDCGYGQCTLLTCHAFIINTSAHVPRKIEEFSTICLPNCWLDVCVFTKSCDRPSRHRISWQSSVFKEM